MDYKDKIRKLLDSISGIAQDIAGYDDDEVTRKLLILQYLVSSIMDWLHEMKFRYPDGSIDSAWEQLGNDYSVYQDWDNWKFRD